MATRTVSICNGLTRGGFYLLFFLTPLLVSPWTYELFEFPKMLFVYILVIVIGSSFLVRMLTDGGYLHRIGELIYRNPLTRPIIFYLLVFVAATAFSIHPYTSIFGYYSRFHGGLLSLLCYLVLFYGYLASFRTDRRGVLITCYLLLASSLLVSVYGVLQHLGVDSAYWVQNSAERVFSTLGQPNWLAAWLLLILPIFWVCYLEVTSLGLSVLLLVLATLVFASFWFTYSLSGMLGLLVTVVAFALLLSRELVPSLKKVFVLFLCYLVVVVSSPGVFETRFKNAWESLTVAGRIWAAERPPRVKTGDTARIRRIVWRGALALWLSSPKNILLGSGPETFAYAFLPYRPVELNRTSEWDFLYNKAHNEYLDILCGTGSLGLVAYLLLIGRFLWWGTRKVRSEKLEASRLGATRGDLEATRYSILTTNRLLLSALLSGWVGLLITNFFGFSTVSTALLFWLYPAICFALSS